jgi:hypothetical protein
MATKMKMVKKGDKMVPDFAADGKGKMMKGGAKPKAMYGASMKPDMMKTGGMVNSNSKVAASKVAKGKVGGISKAPKTAVPKAKYGMSMRKK